MFWKTNTAGLRKESLSPDKTSAVFSESGKSIMNTPPKLLKILLIEDDPDQRFLMGHMLKRGSSAENPFELEFAAKIKEAQERIQAGGIDIVLLDLSLSGTRGLETILLFEKELTRIPFIIYTASDDEKLAVEAVVRGAQDYLVKGQVNSTSLMRSIRYAVERHRLHHELKSTADELQKANEKLKGLVFVDALTGLLNRRGLEMVLHHEIASMKRAGGQLFVVMLDLDNFKKVNDVLGHSVGDVVLKQVAQKIKSALRKTDQACRIGGDEFMVLISQSRYGEAERAAERLRLAISGMPIESLQQKIQVTCSAGMIPVSHEMVSIDELIAHADVFLKESKQRGKNQVVFKGKKKIAGNGDSNVLARDLIEALKDEARFRSVRQPIVDLSSSKTIGYEFLSRFSFEGFEMPDIFFQFCYEKNILNAVDLYCLRRCLSDARTIPGEIRKHFNLFPSTMLGISGNMLLDHFLHENSPEKYCIEISEQQIIGDPDNLLELIQKLRKAGMLIAMDDVGFGKSCLESLIMLQPDVIKIDKKCVRGVGQDVSRRRLLKRLLRVVKTLSFQIIAEGIETQEDLEVIRGEGVRYGQGYFLGRPA